MSPLLSPPSPYKWMPYIAVLPLILVLIRAPSFCSGKNTETHHSSPPSSSLAHQQHPRRPQYSSGAHRNSNGRSRTHCRCYRPENREITMSVAQYPARIYQNAPPGVPIVKVIAHSNATGYLSDFRLENNDDARHFDIGVDGVIKTRDAMTYDVGRTFQFFVSLFDRKADFKHVKIIVSMRNRYSPIFTNSSYSFPVYRYGIGEVIGRVSAFDSDVEPYNRQIYYFADGEQVALRYLEVDRKGNITLMRKIPETTDMLDLKVSAVDSGSPQKSGKVDVIIDVIMVKQPDKFCLSATNTSITMCWKNPMPQRTFKGYTVKVRGAVSRTDSIPLNSSHAEACYSLTGTQIGQRYMFSVTVNSTNFWYGEDMVIAFDNKGSDSTSAGGVDQGVDYPCRCKDGWSADYCTPEDLCLSDPCGRHASCLQVSPERIQCQCHTEYFGDRCQHFRTCLKAPCLNQGSCHMLDDGNYTCTCRPNFSGQNCEFQKPDPCTPNPCVNGQGRCVLISETAKQCECQPGYYGENCQHTDVCMTSFPCLHGGKCVLTEESYECECPSGRMGKNCGINDPCVISICQNGGSCIATETGDYRCDCLPGYHGSECQYSRAVSCLGMNCNNGTCVTDDQTMMKCDCNKGYSGEFCTSYDVCLSTDTPCSGRGQCQSKTRDGNPDVKDEYTCECNQGFYGKDCQKTDFCYPKVCKNGGKCVEIGFNQYDCQCPNGDYSELCQTPDNPCYEHKCLHDATCQANGTAYMCFCQEDWLGELCQDENPCSPSNNPCSGNSNCTVIKLPTETGGVLRNLTADCICPFGKLGKFCQLLHPCRNSPCLHGTCTVTPLAKTANLTEDAYGVGDLFTCQCSQGYTGDICDVKSCDGIRCLNKGDCYKGSCLCPVDFTGPRCETRVAECDDDSVFLDPKCFCDDGTKVCKPNNCELDQIELSTKDMAMICINSTNVNASFDTVFRCCNGTSCEPYSPTCETRTHCTQFGQQDEDCQYFFYKCQKASQEYCAAFEQEDMSCLDLKRKGDREWIKCAESKLKDMENRVKDPSRLDASQVSEIASYVVGNIDAALDKKEIAQSALNVITGLSDVNASVSQEVEQADGTNSKLRGFLDDYTSKVDINNGSVAMKTKGISVQATNVASFQNDEIIFPSKAGNTGVMNGASITLPNNILKLSKFNVSKDSRLQFVGYQKSQLFIPKDDNDSLVPVPEDVMNKQRVISATVSGVHVYNLTEPIKIELPIIQKGNVHNCVFWDDNTSNWSEEGIETFYDSTSGLITCKSYHLTSFAVLMSPTPDALKGQIGLTYITYIGSGISMACLVLTILTYGLFRCLYGEKSGKILLHLCTSLLLLNVVFLLGSVDVSQFSEDVCTAIAILLHYFVLSTLWWMLVEAIEMYRAIVTVFMKYERFYLIKRCLVGWGIPAVIVAATASVKIDYYGLNTVDEDGNDETQICFMTPGGDNIAYYTSLLAPACLIVLVNTIVFILVVRVILKPRFQQQISNNTAPFTPAQVRGAFTVMFLLGVTWIFGPLAIGEAQLVFSYLFCISNCLQGCLIFVFRCLFNPEAKLAWIQFYRTGTFKRRRGPIKSGYMDSSSKDANDNSSNTRRLSNTQNVNLTTSTNYTSGNNSSMKLPLFRGTSGGIHAHPHQLHTTNGWHPNLNGMKRDNGYNNVNGNGDSNNCSGNSSVVSAGSAGSGGSDRRSRGSSRAESDLMDIHSVSNQSSKYDSSFEKADTKPCEFVADSKKDTPTPGGPAGLYKDEFTHL